MNRSTVVLGLSAIALRAAQPARAQTLQHLRVVATAVDQSGALYYARDLGMFAKHGIDISIDTPNDNTLAVPSVVSGTVDIAYINIVSLEQAYRKGIPLVAVAPAAVNDARWPDTSLVVAKDSPIRSPLDLQGKIVGTATLKALGEFATNAWVDQHGGDSSKLKWIGIPYISCGEALEAGRIDAAFVIEPYATQLLGKTRLLGRPYEAIAKRFLGAAYMTTRDWANQHADVVARFAAAIREASVWGNRNPDKSAAILAKYAHVDPDSLANITRSRYGEALLAEEIQPTIDFGVRFKVLDASFPAGDLIYRAS